SQNKAILDLADGIWYQAGFHLKPDFIADNRNFFQAALESVDFTSPKSAVVINKWADKATRGEIQNVVQFPFPPQTRVVLANAIYFKGKWENPFDKNNTRPRMFYQPGGATNQTPMMSQRRNFAYQENAGFQAVRLPYAGGRLEMYLFLPATNSSPQNMLAGFSGENWRDTVLPQFADREGMLVFPKFKLDYDVTLNEPLEQLGMRRAFSPDADFSAMAGEPLFVSEVNQKSFVSVDEEGTEAAAVTTIMMAGRAIMEPIRPFEMIVDRPFFFVIADDQTGSILFMGIVENPAP
ncbi:MAG TPA: serpin family protein, partial [Candidatus Baltobacteraceae bacterium]|nr:serpin family protein [Candidatus Baltobacteraceae bacterium]